MNILIDTNAFLAVLDQSDKDHISAKTQWEKIINAGDELVCHNYILIETSALILQRLGMKAVRVFEKDIVPILHLIWISRDVHEAATGAYLVAEQAKGVNPKLQKSLSLVDCVSLEVMRRTGIRTAFTLDRRFQEFGFNIVP